MLGRDFKEESAVLKRRAWSAAARLRPAGWAFLAIQWTWAIAAISLPPAVLGQSSPVPDVTVPPTPALSVRSTPSGATVLLHGPYELIGTTPWVLSRDLTGVYRVEVRKPGYEPWTGEVVIAPGAGASLDVDLNKKSRIKAFARSVIIPGWGQTYTGNQTRGRTFLAAEVLALGGFIWMNELYQNEVDDFDAAADAYQSAHRQEDLPALRRALQRANRNADRAYDRRQIVVAAAVGVYAVSALDALFFSPMGGPSESDGAERLIDGSSHESGRLALDTRIEPGEQARLGLSLKW